MAFWERVSEISNSLENFFYTSFDYLANTPGNSAIALTLILAATVGAIIGLRHFDRTYNKPWIYYILYLLTLLPVWGVRLISIKYKYEIAGWDILLLFLLMMIFGSLIVFGGWGVRQCGMINGKYESKPSRKVTGDIMLVIVWLILLLTFWDTIIYPFIEWSDVFFTTHSLDLGFILSIVALVVLVAIPAGVMFAWLIYIVPFCFETAGKYTLHLFSITLWWTMVRIGWDWIYANYDGIAFLAMLWIWGVSMIAIIICVVTKFEASRCPRCHYNFADHTNTFDKGLHQSESTEWEDMSGDSISPNVRGAEVINARRLVHTITISHLWDTEHTCPCCGKSWRINHSEVVSTRSTELERRWTERY